MLCSECQIELDPVTSVCANCGFRAGSSIAGAEPEWRQHVREAVERRKRMRRARLAKREEGGRALSILPEAQQPSSEMSEQELLQRHREEIRIRVEKKSIKSRQRRIPVDAGEVSIRGATTEASPLARQELEAELIGPELRYDPSEPTDTQEDRASQYELAAPGERVLSGVIDFGVIFLILLGLVYLTIRILGQPAEMLPGSALAALGSIGSLLAAGYLLFFWSLSGRTLGKLLTGCRVVDPLGRPLGFGRAFLRGVGLVLSVAPLGAGFIGIWSDHERRSWHDRIASTKVIRA